MKILLIILLFFCVENFLFAQNSKDDISGLWYSSDSSRIYKVFETTNGYGANLYFSKRAGDKKGMTVLNELWYDPGKNDFVGIIYSSDGVQSTEAKIKVEANKKLLLIKLPRLLFFPVYIKWYRDQQE